MVLAVPEELLVAVALVPGLAALELVPVLAVAQVAALLLALPP